MRTENEKYFVLTTETIPTPIFSLLLILIAAALLYNRISLSVCTCSVDDAAHEEGEDELGQDTMAMSVPIPRT